MSKRIALIGALWLDNFGDILLADYFKEEVQRLGYEAVFPFCPKKLLEKYGWEGGSIKYFLTADKVVYFGGGYLSTSDKPSLKWTLKRYFSVHQYAEWCRLMRKPYAVIGAGFGPVKGGLAKFSISRVVSGAKFVALRDCESIHELETLKGKPKNKNIFETADFAIANAKSKIKSDSQAVSIGVHCTKPFPELVFAINKLFSELGERGGVKLYIIYDQENQPSPLKVRLKDICREHEVELIELRYENAHKLVNCLSDLSLVVTNKLHVGIVSTSMGVPVISLPWHPKVERYYKQIGQSEYCLYGKTHTGEDIFLLIMKALNRKGSQLVPNKVIEKSKLNGVVLKDFLES